MGWRYPWYSSFGTDFNHDFIHVTNDEAVAPVKDNYEGKEEILSGPNRMSVFLREGGEVFHTYSTYEMLDPLLVVNKLLDLTKPGRQD